MAVSSGAFNADTILANTLITTHITTRISRTGGKATTGFRSIVSAQTGTADRASPVAVGVIGIAGAGARASITRTVVRARVLCSTGTKDGAVGASVASVTGAATGSVDTVVAVSLVRTEVIGRVVGARLDAARSV